MDCVDVLVALLASVIVGLCGGAAAAASYRVTNALWGTAERALFSGTYSRSEAMLLSGVSMLYGAAAAAWVRDVLNTLQNNRHIEATIFNPHWHRQNDIPPPYGQGAPPERRTNPFGGGGLPPFWFGARDAEPPRNAEPEQHVEPPRNVEPEQPRNAEPEQLDEPPRNAEPERNAEPGRIAEPLIEPQQVEARG